jgi:phosphoribosylaminoimidazole (AIR) synthetase
MKKSMPPNTQQTQNDSISTQLFSLIQQSWTDDVLADVATFHGSKCLRITDDMYLGMNCDGIGTKVELSERLSLGHYRGLGYDLVAAVCDDTSAFGGVPLALTTVLDVGITDEAFPDVLIELYTGIVQAAKMIGVPVINGEFAQLGSRVQGYGENVFNINATVSWTAKRKQLLSAKEICVGDYIIGLEEEGLRCNGLTLFRETMQNMYGKDWHVTQSQLTHFALTPSRIYTPFIQRLLINFRPILHNVVHVTGGGLCGRLRRTLSQIHFGAHIYDVFPLHAFYDCLQKHVGRNVAYNTWNMGHGMLLFIEDGEQNRQAIFDSAKCSGISARVIGRVTSTPDILFE